MSAPPCSVTQSHSLLAVTALVCMTAGALGAQRPAAQQPALAPISQHIRAGAPVRTIGLEEDPGPLSFGLVRDVAYDGSGNIYVLDEMAQSIRSFSPTGAFLSAVGRSGRGPGDIADPTAISHDGRERLYLADQVNGISVYSTKGGTLTYLTRIQTLERPVSVCAIGDQIVVQAWHNDRILHVLSATGTVVRSFGGSFGRDTSAFMRQFVSEAGSVLSCDPERQEIYVAHIRQNDVRKYHLSGRSLWVSALPEYLGPKIYPRRAWCGHDVWTFQDDGYGPRHAGGARGARAGSCTHHDQDDDGHCDDGW